jgi:hypothetical protein
MKWCNAKATVWACGWKKQVERIGGGAELLYTDPFRVSCYLHAITYVDGVFISKELHNTDSMNFVKTFLDVWYGRSV